jgi:hypothetical protein
MVTPNARFAATACVQRRARGQPGSPSLPEVAVLRSARAETCGRRIARGLSRMAAKAAAGLLQEKLAGQQSAQMPRLTIKRDRYDPVALESWTRRRRNALSFPPRIEGFRRLLRRKARGREKKTPRFFGEAFIAVQSKCHEAYYGSFKWLTNPRFAKDQELANPDQERLRAALHRHFTRKRIEKLQRVVEGLSRSCRKDLGKRRPTAPDLWLVDRHGRHRFIEVKLPGDSAAPHQLAGMAAIAFVLRGPKVVSVEVIHLDDDDRLFRALCRAMRAG